VRRPQEAFASPARSWRFERCARRSSRPKRSRSAGSSGVRLLRPTSRPEAAGHPGCAAQHGPAWRSTVHRGPGGRGGERRSNCLRCGDSLSRAVGGFAAGDVSAANGGSSAAASAGKLRMLRRLLVGCPGSSRFPLEAKEASMSRRWLLAVVVAALVMAVAAPGVSAVRLVARRAPRACVGRRCSSVGGHPRSERAGRRRVGPAAGGERLRRRDRGSQRSHREDPGAARARDRSRRARRCGSRSGWFYLLDRHPHRGGREAGARRRGHEAVGSPRG